MARRDAVEVRLHEGVDPALGQRGVHGEAALVRLRFKGEAHPAAVIPQRIDNGAAVLIADPHAVEGLEIVIAEARVAAGDQAAHLGAHGLAGKVVFLQALRRFGGVEQHVDPTAFHHVETFAPGRFDIDVVPAGVFGHRLQIFLLKRDRPVFDAAFGGRIGVRQTGADSPASVDPGRILRSECRPRERAEQAHDSKAHSARFFQVCKSHGRSPSFHCGILRDKSGPADRKRAMARFWAGSCK